MNEEASSTSKAIPLLFSDHPELQGPISTNLDRGRFSATFQALEETPPPSVRGVLPLKTQHDRVMEGWPGGRRTLSLHSSPEAAGVCADKLACDINAYVENYLLALAARQDAAAAMQSLNLA